LKRCAHVGFEALRNILASGHDNGAIQIIDARDGRVLQRFVSGARIDSLAWSPDDRLLVSAHDDGTQRVWHVPSGTELGILHRGGYAATTRFSPDGRRLATVCLLNDFRSQGILWKLDE